MSLRRHALTFLALTAACTSAVGCYRQDMARQPKYHWPDLPSDFFADGRAARPIEPGTVARGQLRADAPRFTGLEKGAAETTAEPKYVTELPYRITDDIMERGRERFNIYCALCHGRLGNGEGKIVQRGYAKPPSFHDERLRTMPVGRVFEIITRGYGAMPDYADMIPADDRWAIIAYLRALQLSQNVAAGDLTDADRAALQDAKPPQARPGPGGRNGD